MTYQPLLLLESAERDGERPSRVRATVRVGGHQVDAVFDLMVGDMRFIGYVDIPWVLSLHEPSLKAVGRAVVRIERGEFVELPLDLSEEVRNSEPRNPWVSADPETRRRKNDEADRVDQELKSFQVGGEDGRRFVAHVDLRGDRLILEGECYVAEGASSVIRWLSKEVIDSLTEAEHHAVWRSIVQEVERRQRNSRT